MKQSQLFTKTKKEAPKDEASVNAELLIRAGYIDKLMAGVYSFLPLGWRVMQKIENIIREEIGAIGGQELFMPTLQPKENWEKTGRWDAMDDLYKVKDKSDREFALGPTHEEIIVPLAKKYINSYKDVPFYAYQIQNKFRMELRAKSGLLRGREFLMKDLYSFHLDENDLDAYYEKAKSAYFKIFDRCGLKDKTYLTFASGGSFSKYSHEFQTLSEAGEDTIYICQKCSVAINKEIKNETPKCPECGGGDFREEKAIEVGNIFKLNDKFSKPFNLTVKNEKGEDKIILMGCYGIGLSRLMGTIVEVYHDEKGIIWPKSVAPFKVHLLVLGSESTVRGQADKIYNDLQKQKVEVLFDDRDVSAGEKFADSDLLGIPNRVVVSEKSLKSGGVELKKRNKEESKIIDSERLLKEL
jgi:prolyl-tRNA synthetase